MYVLYQSVKYWLDTNLINFAQVTGTKFTLYIHLYETIFFKWYYNL